MSIASEGTALLNGHLDPDISKNFGKKTINSFSSYALLINNITGPGLVAMCVAYQHGGWIPATLVLGVGAISSVLSAGFLIQTMTRFRGNEEFQSRVEFMEMARALFPRWAYYLVFFLFLFNITTSNVSAIVESAQTLDSTFLMSFGQACALEIAPSFGFICVDKMNPLSDSVFGENVWYISLGFIMLAIISVPVGLWNLEENMIIQNLSLIALCLLLSQFCMQFLYNGLHPEYLPVSSLQAGAGITLGSILFNFAFVVTVPSWVNEKRPDVKIHSSLWFSIAVGTLMFVIMGAMGAMAYQFPFGADLLTKLNQRGQWMLTRLGALFFPPLVLVPGIPILSIIVRYNLLENKVCGPFWANIYGVILPWVIAMFLMSGNLLNFILNWSGLLTVAPLNFLIPCAMFLKSMSQEGVFSKSMVRLSFSSAGLGGLVNPVVEGDSKVKTPTKEKDNIGYQSYSSTTPTKDQEAAKVLGSEAESLETWKMLPISDEGSISVAWGVIFAVSCINIAALVLAFRGHTTSGHIPQTPP